MKNIIKKTFFFISLMAILTVVMSGCSSNSVTYEEMNYEISASEVETLTIDVSDRYIDISKSDDNQIHIVYYVSEKEFYDLNLSDSKELKMKCAYDKSWTDYIGFKAPKKDRTIQIQVPDAGIKNLTLVTSYEDISVPTLSFLGELKVKLDEGNISLDKVNVGKAVRLEAKNGNISGTIAGTYDDFSITSNAKSGKNNLPAKKNDGTKTLYVYTDNGNISLELLK